MAIESDYDFRDVSPTEVEEIVRGPTEGFTFGNYNTADHDLYLTSRDAPTPDEQTVTDSIPYMQGLLDYSMLGDQRYWNRRDVTFELMRFDTEYADRKELENELKRAIVPLGERAIYDTHNKGYHWLGKAKSVSVDDDAEKRTLTATVVFDCYPFAVRDTFEGDDFWDDVYFPAWVFQQVKYTVSGTRTVNVINISDSGISPTMIVTGSLTITGDFGTVVMDEGQYSDTQVMLDVGTNSLTLDGTGTIQFVWQQEAMF